MNPFEGIREGSFKMVMWPIAWLKCLYTNACSMEQEELGTMVQLRNYDLTPIMEIWWNESQNWTTRIEGYKLFRRDGEGGAGMLPSTLRNALIAKSCLGKTGMDRLRACG